MLGGKGNRPSERKRWLTLGRQHEGSEKWPDSECILNITEILAMAYEKDVKIYSMIFTWINRPLCLRLWKLQDGLFCGGQGEGRITSSIFKLTIFKFAVSF